MKTFRKWFVALTWALLVGGWLCSVLSIANPPAMFAPWPKPAPRYVQGRTIAVPIGGNIQAAADSASCGDHVVAARDFLISTKLGIEGLEVPALILRKQCPDNNSIVIEAADSASIPSLELLSTARIKKLRLPEIVTNQSTPAVEFVANASSYRMIGWEVRNNSRGKTIVNNGLIIAGIRHGSSPGITLKTVPRKISWERSWVHSEEDGTPDENSEIATCLRGFALGAADFSVIDSRVVVTGAFTPLPFPIKARGVYSATVQYVAGDVVMHDGEVWQAIKSQTGATPDRNANWTVVRPQSTQAIFVAKGPGPYNFAGNMLSAWFTSIFYGGDPQWITNQTTVVTATASRATLTTAAGIKVGTYLAFKVSGQKSPYQVARVTAVNGNVVDYVGQPGIRGGTTGNPLLVAPDAPGDVVWDGDLPRNSRITNNAFWKNSVVANAAAVFGLYGKGHIELKAAENTLIEGNDFDGFGSGYTFTSRNQPNEDTAGSNPWATIRNLTFRNNRWRSTSAPGKGTVMGIQLNDDNATTYPGSDVLIENNLLENLGSPLLDLTGATNVVVRHNTALGGTPADEVSMIFCALAASPGFRLENNILQNNEYGLNSALGSTQACYSGYVMAGNVVLDNRRDRQTALRYPGNFIARSLAAIKLTADWKLAADSPYKGKGTDGKDPGCDVTRLGTAPPAPPPHTPSPPPTR